MRADLFKCFYNFDCFSVTSGSGSAVFLACISSYPRRMLTFFVDFSYRYYYFFAKILHIFTGRSTTNWFYKIFIILICVLAVLTLCAIGYAYKWNAVHPDQALKGATAIFGGGIAHMIDDIIPGSYSILNSLLVLTYSAFCLTSLDTATRLARFMFQEFWLEPGETCRRRRWLGSVGTDDPRNPSDLPCDHPCYWRYTDTVQTEGGQGLSAG